MPGPVISKTATRRPFVPRTKARTSSPPRTSPKAPKKTVRLLVPDLSNVAVKGEPLSFSCGVQKPRSITVDYAPKVDPKLGTAGQIAAIELGRQPGPAGSKQ